MKHIIFDNYNVDFDAWVQDYIDYHSENHWEEEPTQDNVWKFIDEMLAMELDCKRMNLNIETDGAILVVATLDLWNGKRSAYKILDGNVNQIFKANIGDYYTWYYDGYNVRCDDYHHDGTNHYLFREIRPDRNIQNLLDDIYYGREITRKKLNYYTKSLRDYVRQVYGWR